MQFNINNDKTILSFNKEYLSKIIYKLRLV